MNRNDLKIVRHRRRRIRVRKRVFGMPARPRVSVFRSLNHIYAQIVDDLSGRTLCSASSREKGFAAEGGKCGSAKAVGAALAKRAVEAGIGEVVFDRGGYRYHGRVKALADGAREGGLTF